MTENEKIEISESFKLIFRSLYYKTLSANLTYSKQVCKTILKMLSFLFGKVHNIYSIRDVDEPNKLYSIWFDFYIDLPFNNKYPVYNAIQDGFCLLANPYIIAEDGYKKYIFQHHYSFFVRFQTDVSIGKNRSDWFTDCDSILWNYAQTVYHSIDLCKDDEIKKLSNFKMLRYLDKMCYFHTKMEVYCQLVKSASTFHDIVSMRDCMRMSGKHTRVYNNKVLSTFGLSRNQKNERYAIEYSDMNKKLNRLLTPNYYDIYKIYKRETGNEHFLFDALLKQFDYNFFRDLSIDPRYSDSYTYKARFNSFKKLKQYIKKY